MDIVQANVSDAEEILLLQRLTYESQAKLYNDYSIPPLTQTLEEMRQDLEKQIVLKAQIGAKIIGSVRASLDKDTCHIGRLMVHPDFQNQGIATQLMTKLESLVTQCRKFELFTGHKSEKSLYIYEKLGFKRIKVEKASEQISLVYLEKRL